MRREDASIQGLVRQLGTTWRTVWLAIQPLLEAMAADLARFDGVTDLGVDEHIWHHVSTKPPEDGGRGPKELTGMVDLSRNAQGKVSARLLDLVPGRSGQIYREWLDERGQDFRAGVEVAILDPFLGYKNDIGDQLEDAVAVVDAFHVVKLGTQAVDDVRRRVQQQARGHRGRKGLRWARELHRPATHPIRARDRCRRASRRGRHRLAVRSAYKAASIAEGDAPLNAS